MTQLLDQIVGRIAEASGLYYRLVLVVAPAGSRKTDALLNLSERTGLAYINVNLELSRMLLEVPAKRRVTQVQPSLARIVTDVGAGAVLLDNIEILFDVSLRQDPLKLLQAMSRNRTVVAAWNGSIQSEQLTYAAPGHPEYRRYDIEDFLVVSPA